MYGETINIATMQTIHLLLVICLCNNILYEQYIMDEQQK